MGSAAQCNANPHLLSRTKCYLAGNIENSNAPSQWRDVVKTELKDTGIIFFDPLKKPFLDSVNEDKEHIARLVKLRAEGGYKELARVMRKIRVEDLSLVDRADFLIASISAKTASWGTAEEVFWANRMKKPIFLAVAEGAALPVLDFWDIARRPNIRQPGRRGGRHQKTGFRGKEPWTCRAGRFSGKNTAEKCRMTKS